MYNSKKRKKFTTYNYRQVKKKEKTNTASEEKCILNATSDEWWYEKLVQ